VTIASSQRQLLDSLRTDRGGGFEPNVSWNSLGAHSLPADKNYIPTGITLMAALAYNKNKVKSPPTAWQQLLSSQPNDQRRAGPPGRAEPGDHVRSSRNTVRPATCLMRLTR
jgi:hypothetical protein